MIFPLGVLYAEEELAKKGVDGADMRLVPAGEFLMGSDEEDLEEDARPHKVYMDSFYMDKYEVTNELFAKFLNSVSPSEGVGGQRWGWVVLRSDVDMEERKIWWPTEILYESDKKLYTAFSGFELYPVITASWYAADAYCKWAGERLPTEAEWEKAARGGLENKRFPWGNEIPTGGVVFDRRWISNTEPVPTEKAGNYYPNGYGIYEMAGNVWEWCADWYSAKYYKKSPYKNPVGPAEGKEKVIRGGSWYNSAGILRVALRGHNFPGNLDDAIGFRCVMNAAGDAK